MKKLLLFALTTLLMNASFAGGPWTQAKGKGYFKLSEWGVYYNMHFNGQGMVEPNSATGIFNTSLYGEYGITNRLTATVHFPFLSHIFAETIAENPGALLSQKQSLTSIGDTDLGIKYSLTKPGSKIPVAATVVFGLPLGTTNESGTLRTGDGEFNQLLMLDAGKGFSLGNGLPVYASATLGFNNRTQGFSDELRFGIEGGIGLMNEKLWLITRVLGVESLKNGTMNQKVIPNPGIFSNNTEYISMTVEASYFVTKKTGVSLTFAPAFRGENIAASPSFSAGVFLDLNK